jgi:hypothetical protein
MKKIILNPLWLLLFAWHAEAKGEDLLRFRYVPNEGLALTCSHERIRDLPDWRVSCGGEKSFTAHVIVRESEGEAGARLEIHYWVTAPGENERAPRKFHSTTALLHLNKGAETRSMILFQGVENDQASLVLDWSAP